MAEFTVNGPFEVPFYQGAGGRTIRDDDIAEFWRKHATYSSERGCYVFSMRAGGGLTPGYVGKATKTLKQEVFTGHKLSRYQQFLADYAKGTPVLFFVTLPRKKGKPNVTAINQLERYLIDLAVTANPDLLNVKGTQQDEWGIKGVKGRDPGTPSKAAKLFRKMLGLEPEPKR